MDPISAIFTISEDQLQVVSAKMAAGQTLEVDAYDRDAKTKLAQGSLTTLDNQIDPTTGTLKLRATFKNAKGTLFPNQFVNVRLLVQEKHGVTLAPTAAIQRNSQATYVYVVKPDSTVTVRAVTIGTTEGDDSEVTSGLMPGEVVVMTGVDKLQEGSKVSAKIPAANSPGSPSASKPLGKLRERSPPPQYQPLEGKLDETVSELSGDGGLRPAAGFERMHGGTTLQTAFGSRTADVQRAAARELQRGGSVRVEAIAACRCVLERPMVGTLQRCGTECAGGAGKRFEPECSAS